MNDVLSSAVNVNTSDRLKRHGLTLALDYDMTGEYRNMRCGEALLSVEIHSDRNAITDSSTILHLSDEKIDDQVNEKIDDLIKKIDSERRCAIKVTFDVTKRDLPDNIDPMTRISHTIDTLFGIKPTFGSVKVDTRMGRYEVNLLLHSLPYFRVINRKAIRNLYPPIHQYIGELLESGYFESPQKEQVMDLLNTDSSYDRWTLLMLNALMMVLLDPVKGVQFVHATHPK